MAVEYTKYFNLVAVRNETPSARDWAATYWNWITADKLLYSAAVGHKHDNKPALENPDGTLSVATNQIGGTILAGKTYYIAATFIDYMGQETGKSEIASISTISAIEPPSKPVFEQATDLEPEPNALTGAMYGYKLSYVKCGGETTCGEAVFVTVPTDTTYSVTIHFDSLDTASNGADKIFIYRKINNGMWNKLIEISSSERNYYTDDNTAVPTCDIGPKLSNTTNAFNTITIDWSNLENYLEAENIRIYVSTAIDHSTQEPRWISTNHLIGEFPIGGTTSYTWTGTNLFPGYPPEVSQSIPSPSKIDLETETQGSLGWGQLPEGFNWQDPVDTYMSLGIGGIKGEVRLVLDTMSLYAWDINTFDWLPITGGGGGGGGIKKVAIPQGNEEDPMEDYLPTEDIANGDLCLVYTSVDEEDSYAYRTGLFQYHANWDPPKWIKLNTLPVVPFEITDLWNDQFVYGEDKGTMWMEETEWGTYLLNVYDEYGRTLIPTNKADVSLRTTKLINEGIFSRHTLFQAYSYEDEARYANNCYAFLDNGQLAYISEDRSLCSWEQFEWSKLDAFYFRGSGDYLPEYQDENDVYILGDKVKKSMPKQTRNLLVTEEQAGVFKDQIIGVESWEGVDGATVEVSDYGMFLEVNPSQNEGSGIQTPYAYAIPVEGSVSYTFNCHAYGFKQASWRIYLDWYDSTQEFIKSDSAQITVYDFMDNHMVFSNVASPANAAYCIIKILTDQTFGGFIEFNNFQFEKGSMPTEWVSPIQDWETLGFSKCRGTFEKPTDLPDEAEDNDIAYVLKDASNDVYESWYIYNSGWAPAGVRRTGETIDEISSGSPSVGDLKDKINELLVALKNSGVIE